MSENIVFLDVETLPIQNQSLALRATELLKPPANYKKEEAIQKWREDQTGKMGLYSWAAEPVCIAWQHVRTEEEPEILPTYSITRQIDDTAQMFFHDFVVEFENFMTARNISATTIKIAGWNIGFDLGMLRAWSCRYAAKLPFYLPQRKYDTSHQLDVMSMWNPYEPTALRKAWFALTGEVYEDSGADVAEQWEKGQRRLIWEHCESDVRRTSYIWECLESWVR